MKIFKCFLCPSCDVLGRGGGALSCDVVADAAKQLLFVFTRVVILVKSLYTYIYIYTYTCP